jgi:hypothetical protein
LDHLIEFFNGLWAFIEDFPAVRNILIIADNGRGSRAVGLGADSINRKMDLNSFRLCLIHNLLESVRICWHIYLGNAKLMAIELPQEWVTHASSNDDFVSNVEHVKDEFDFISYL